MPGRAIWVAWGLRIAEVIFSWNVLWQQPKNRVLSNSMVSSLMWVSCNRAEPTGHGICPETIYTRGKASDHMAQKVTVFLDLVEEGKAGNRAIINYNNREGWKLYTVISHEFAPEIMETV